VPAGFRRTIFALVLLAAAAGACGPAFPATVSELDSDIKAEEKRLDAIERQIAYHRKQVAEASKKEKGLLNDIAKLSQEIVVLKQEIKLLDMKKERAEIRIKELEKEIVETTAKLEETKSYLAKRFVAIYKYGGVAEFNLLLSASSAHDALINSFLLQRIAREDERRATELAEQRRRLEAATNEMQQQKSALDARIQELSTRKNELSNVEGKRRGVLGTLKREKKLHSQAAAELEQAQKELQSTIRKLLAEKRKLLEANRTTPVTVMPSGGKLQWPVRGRVTSPFGMRVHPVFKTKMMHTGIDISASEGTPVKAAAPGEVLFAGWLRGYGQIVIIDHGRNLTTVYAHLSVILVEEGEAVKYGTLIGKVGSTGVSTGPHLHFEVRVNGDAKNPRNYLGS